MRSLTALALVSALTSNAALAAEACSFEHAVYADGALGYELRFRPAESWELGGMISTVYELAMPDGRMLWGYLHSNMGTSRDEGSLFYGCERPGPDDGSMSEAEIEACRVWNNNVYALADGQIGYTPMADELAPPSLVLADIGRALRYSVLSSPGEEPWDQFMLKGCAS